MWEPKLALLKNIDGSTLARSRIAAKAEFLNSLTEISTSIDYPDLMSGLEVDEMPIGVHQTQLPFGVFEAETFFASFFEPDVHFPEHVHNSVSILRFVLGGSIILGTKKLCRGDWMFVPMGIPYALRSGVDGAIVIHVYGPPPS